MAYLAPIFHFNCFRMKQIIVFMLLMVSISVKGQSHKQAVTSQFLAYYELLREKKFEQSAEYMNPDIFKIIPKDQLIAAMATVYSTPGMDIETDAATMKDVGPLVKKNNMSYAVLRYGSVIRIRMTGDMANSTDSSILRKSFENQFGKENVRYDPQTGFFSIYADKKAVGNSTDGKKWTFVVVEPRQMEMLKKFIPEELLKD